MNSIFFIGEYNGYINANKKIALTIADQMIKHGNAVTLIAFSFVCEKAYNTIIQNFNLLVLPANVNRIKDINNYQNIRKTNSIVKCILKYPETFFSYHFKNKYNDLLINIIDIINHNNYDFMFCFYNPFEPSYALLKSNQIKCKKIIYSLDSWSFNKTRFTSKVLNIFQERNAFSKSKIVFVHSAQYSQFINSVFYKNLKNRIFSLNFPNILKANSDVNTLIKFDDSIYNFVYLGALTDSNRNPENVIKFINNCSNIYKFKYKIFFIGKIYSDICERYKTILPNNIIVMDPIMFDTANSIMNDNVILLNINNMSTTQSPSKILDYISTGNPILNVVKNTNNSCLSLLEPYNNCFNYFEDETKYGDFYRFLLNKKVIDFDYISKTYYEYTPEYVYKQIESTLNGIK